MFQQFVQLESLYECYRDGQEERFKADLIRKRKEKRQNRRAGKPPAGSISNLDLTVQTSAPGANERDAKRNEARPEWSLAIS